VALYGDCSLRGRLRRLGAAERTGTLSNEPSAWRCEKIVVDVM